MKPTKYLGRMLRYSGNVEHLFIGNTSSLIHKDLTCVVLIKYGFSSSELGS
jgi:hypothetical protein